MPIVVAELKRRHEKINMPSAKKGLIRVGDTRCHLLAAWGKAYQAHWTETRTGSSAQYVFSGSYVYIENDRIVAIQD